VTITPQSVAFRPLCRSDFPLLERWLREPHVQRWWREPLDLAGLEAKYGDRIDGIEPTYMFVIEDGGRPVGWIQWYRWSDYKAHAKKIGAAPSDAGLDLAIGAPDMIGHGLGPLVLKLFIEQVVFADPSVTAVVSDPEAANVRSRRAFEKVGFQSSNAVVLNGEMEPRVIVRLNRTGTIAGP
jgi:aminoglycoside 6'-N-acetyltransferase